MHRSNQLRYSITSPSGGSGAVRIILEKLPYQRSPTVLTSAYCLDGQYGATLGPDYRSGHTRRQSARRGGSYCFGAGRKL
jgi:hypothetical protein